MNQHNAAKTENRDSPIGTRSINKVDAGNEQDPHVKERFDFEEMMTFVDNDLETGIMMLSNFLETEVDTFNKIVTGASKDAEKIDWMALRKDAHSLKGSSSYLCAKQVSFLALEMQRAAEAQNKEQVDRLVPLLVQEFELAVSYMDAQLELIS